MSTFPDGSRYRMEMFRRQGTSRTVMNDLKNDKVERISRLPMSDWVAGAVAKDFGTMPFKSIFDGHVTIVPVPRSGLHRPGSLWVPERMAKALTNAKVWSKALPCLRRTQAVPKASKSASHWRAEIRPTAPLAARRSVDSQWMG